MIRILLLLGVVLYASASEPIPCLGKLKVTEHCIYNEQCGDGLICCPTKKICINKVGKTTWMQGLELAMCTPPCYQTCSDPTMFEEFPNLGKCADPAPAGGCTCQSPNFPNNWVDTSKCGSSPPPTPSSSCSDNLMNGDETGVDCGGSCPACPTCTDKMRNGDEVGIDCGGSKCPACPPPTTCSDKMKNGDESGVDCGGSCPACSALPPPVAPPSSSTPGATNPSQGSSANEVVPEDCEVSEWASWSACSKTCQGGTSKRTRGIMVEATNGGSCDYILEQSRKCNSEIPCSTVCKVSEWGEWSACSKTCGAAVQSRSRTVVVPSAGSGASCPPLSETQPCNLKSCSVDCVMGDWSSWSDCDATCGGGQQSRTRSVLVQPVGEGQACGNTFESTACNTTPCPVNCELSEWASWSKCDKSCGGGKSQRTRGVEVEPANGGEACLSTQQTNVCNTNPCPIDCTVSSWGVWTSCSVSCGGGSRTRTRVVSIQAQNGGASCPSTSETETCNTNACPIDCVLSEWKSWEACSVTCGGGIQRRTRGVITQASEGGAECGATEETAACNAKPCPADCVVSDWGSWSVCDRSCAGGSQSRTRQVTSQPQNGGIECPNTQEVQKCNEVPCPVDCILGEFSEWSVCDKTCGGGSSSRSRTVITGPMFSGKACDETAQTRTCNTSPCPVDCVMSAWSEWSTCTKSCGGGLTQRTRQITTQPNFGAPACDVTVEVNSCSTNECPVDCEMAEWSSWSSCSQLCGSGTQTRTRAVLVPSAFGGLECAETSKVLVCNTKPCPVDCKLSEWTEWSTCDKTCGGGKQTRTRTITVESNNGGLTCPSTIETQACAISPCPVDCVVSDWSVWSTCDKTCGTGSQTRTRSVVTASEHGGVACPDTSATQTCNTDACPVDCVMDDWSVWGDCDVTCGGGKQLRTKKVIISAQFGGKECGVSSEYQTCNTQSCPVDCVMGEFSSWSVCDRTCGSGSRTRTRSIVVAPLNEGRVCGASSESEVCNSQPCPVDCVMSDWSSWSECDVTCGGGSSTRTRSITIAASNEGASCGNTQETTTCNVQPCPVDCVMGQWTGWSECDKTCGSGSQQRTRRIHTPAAFGGKACESGLETQSCNTTPCPVDCVVSDWAVWSTCTKSCGGGSQTRTRTVITSSENQGTPCPELNAERACNTDPCPVDCVLSEWTKWSECDKTCGSGSRSRSRSVIQASLFAGAECGSLQETEACNTEPCPVDCVMSDWLPWGSCSKTCGGGEKSRTRIMVTFPQFGGRLCPSTVETETCNVDPCPVDCVLSDWTEWSVCDVSCGGGVQKRTRSIVTEARDNGKACESLSAERSCNDQACPVDCIMSPWTAFNDCDKKCGGGSQTRTRDIIVPASQGGKACAETHQTQTCNEQECAVDCEMTEWAAWSSCSQKCGGGTSTRTRGINVAPAFGGVPCPVSEQVNVCNTTPCPVDCVMSSWSEWTECSKTCDGGVSTRARTVTTSNANGGAECGASIETKECNINRCPVDCVLSEWDEWTICDKVCGSGSQTRKRTITTNFEFGGKTCEGPLTESRACNTFPCPVDCVLSDWTSWTECDRTCGGGSQTRTKVVNVEAQFGGQACGSTSETQQCNTQPCLVDCVMGQWSQWSICDQTCGSGITTRTRDVLVQPSNEGRQCDISIDQQPCNTHPCPVDCVMSEFSEWTVCDKSCGEGQSTRTRTVKTSSENGGAACGASSEVVKCNSGPCPVDCVMSEWSDFSACTKTCGGGSQTRTRTITVEAAFVGKPCSETSETIECNVVACPVDCVMSEWSSFSPCDRSCGSGVQTRTRSITVSPQFGGKLCEITQESKECNSQPCPVDCVMSSFSVWSDCDKLCGGGSQTRTRTVMISEQNGGAVCGTTSETQVCNTTPCPVDCVLSTWSEWTQCPATCGGAVQRRTRSITVTAAFGGQECASTAEERICNSQACPVDCVVSQWSKWSECSEPCAGGKLTRTRTIKVPAGFGGKECPATYESQACNTQPCPIDCVMSDWGKWTECTKTCGAGHSTRTRDIVVKSQNGGRSCGLSAEWKACNLQPCPIDCVMGDWGLWSACSKSCGTGSRTRTRKAIVASQFGGKACQSTQEVETCNTKACPVDCIMSEWSSFSQCDKTCGSGVQTRTRTVIRAAQFGGASCPEDRTQTQKCNAQSCPVDCQMGEWSEFTTCSKDCGLGTQTRTRNVLVPSLNGGKTCSATFEQRTCNSQPCAIDCVMGPWTEWAECSKTCGSGKTTRTRLVATASAYGGKECGATFETKACNEQPCPIDCLMGAWSTWTPCSVSCGGGVTTRSRPIAVASSFGGLACQATEESKRCNEKECPVDCVMGTWGTWSTCNRVCGGGSQIRTRSIVVASMGGKECEATSESQVCNTQPCAVDCVMGSWSQWTSCDKSCGKGSTSRSRSIVVQSQYGGKACESTVEVIACNSQECPQDCVVQPWGAWSTCDKSCGGGVSTRSRAILVPSLNAGRECPQLQEVQKCNEQACPVNCVMGDWSNWGECSQKCGGGYTTRNRRITVQPSGNGKPCLSTIDTKRCNTKPCPVDCKVSDWSSWSECTATCGGGKQYRTRKVVQNNANGGSECPSQQETQSCNVQVCPVDCVMSEWTSFGACSKLCGRGVQYRTRSVTRPASIGGQACGVTSESKECNTQECPVDCVMSSWGSWAPCDKTCGGGFSSRTRTVQRSSSNGGVPCGSTIEHQQCSQTPCPVDCVMGSWSQWSVCSKPCGTGASTRTRAVIRGPVAGGRACESSVETKVCNVEPCVANCVQSEWTVWSRCSVTCGTGIRTRTRKTITQPSIGGAKCGPTFEQSQCSEAKCPADCVMTAFGAWSVCDKSCGGGVMRRQRYVQAPAVNGGSCGQTVEVASCNTQTCVTNCVMGDWGAWSACSVTCGAGVKTRARRVAVAGVGCGATHETQACTIKPCAVDCSMSNWGEWSQCSKQCGGGSQQRVRTIYQAASNGGAACQNTVEQRVCNTGACATKDCVMSDWTSWAPCSATCGMFAMTKRTRTIISNPSAGGAACGATEESKTCDNLPSCPGGKGGGVKGGSFKGLRSEQEQTALSVMSSPLVFVAIAVAAVALVALVVIVRRRRSVQVMDDGFYQDF